MRNYLLRRYAVLRHNGSMWFILIFSFSCAAQADNLAEYVAQFQNDVNIYAPISLDGSHYSLKNITFRVDKIPTEWAGVCRKSDEDSDEPREIVISIQHWDEEKEIDRLSVLYHEMGHCLLNREHLEGTINFNGKIIPRSLMSAEHFSGRYFETYKEYYIQELFYQNAPIPILKNRAIEDSFRRLDSLLLPDSISRKQ